MQGVAFNTIIAGVLYFVFTLIWHGVGEGQIFGAIAAALVFTLAFAAIQVAIVIFRSDRG